MGKKVIKTRIYDIAKEYKISSDALLKVLRGLGFTIKSHMSVASDDMLEAIADKFKREIEEVKKDDVARKQKLLELEAKKRREEAEKAALKRKAEAAAKKRKMASDKRAKELAAKELAKQKKDVLEAEEKALAAEKDATKKPEEKPVKAVKAKAAEVTAAPKKLKPAPAPKPAAKPVTIMPAPVVAPPETAARATAGSKPTKTVETPSRGGGRKPAPKVMAGGGPPRGRKRRKKRDKGGRGRGEHIVDKAAVKLTFKQTMATLESGKKVKKHKRRTQIGEEIVEGAPMVEITEFMSLSELAKSFDKRPAELVAKCMELGMLASINQRLDMDTIEMLAIEFEFNIKQMEEVGLASLDTEDEKNLQPRSPIVTIMGHVDHGKTTLLDYIRKSSIVDSESGKITQHIGAYEVQTDSGRIAFLDTPGHKAFSAMRARGAQVTDIVVLVVSATEAVMPQTLEAINHSQAAGVPIIVAINKMDLPDANSESVRQQLSNHNLLDESWGGKTIMVEISAKKGTGVDKLMEMILLQAEVMELKADPDIKAQGTVIEARLEKGRGPVANILVQKGSLSVGMPIVAGTFHGRIRAMVDDLGNNMEKAGPSQPLQITGLAGVPDAGDPFMVTADEAEARSISMKRAQIKRELDIRRAAPTTLESVYAKIKDGQISDLKIIIKGDVAGSVEALRDTLNEIGNDEVRAFIIHTGVGAITESDVLLAVASQAIIIGFHVTADPRAREKAIKEKVEIRTYSIIYEAQEDITRAVEGLLKPEMVEKWLGSVEVRQTFRAPKVGVICGSYVQQGQIRRGDQVRVSRNGVVVHEGTISSLRRFKEDAKEVATGLECGIGIDKFDDVHIGDIIEAYELIPTERRL